MLISAAIESSQRTFNLGVKRTRKTRRTEEIKRRVELAGLWRDVEICDGLDELTDYGMKHRKKKE
jgi:hypothetical protein